MEYKIVIDGSVVACFLNESDRDLCLAYFEIEFPDCKIEKA